MISIIVPVYNVEKYLNKCIESILNQSYTDIQLILVNDGSTDSSSKICDFYAEKDSRIIVINKKNGGLSSARNAGLNAATGEYICFIDSDDYLDLDFCKKMISKMIEYKADIVMCNFKPVYELKKTNIKYETSNKNDFFVTNKNDIYKLLFTHRGMINVTNKLFKKRFFDNLEFTQGVLHEDVFIILDILSSCNQLYYLDEGLYNRLIREESIMTTPNKKRLDSITGFKKWYDFFEKNNKEYLPFVAVNICDAILFNYSILYKILTKDERKKLLLDFQKYYKKFWGKFPFKKKVKFFVFYYFPNLIKYLILKRA